MRIIKKGLAVMLAALLVLSLGTGVVAAEIQEASVMEAVQAGREAVYTASAKWYSTPFVSDDVNDGISALLNAMTFDGRYYIGDSDPSYLTLEMRLDDDETVLPVEYLIEDDMLYIRSPLFRDTVRLSADDIEGFIENIDVYLESESGDEMAGAYVKMAEQYQEQVQAMTEIASASSETEAQALARELYAEYGLDGTYDLIETFIEEKMASGEVVEETVTSAFEGVEIASATEYVLTKDEIIALVESLLDEFESNDAYWTYIVENMDAMSMSSGADDISVDELMESFTESAEMMREQLSEIPDDLFARLLVCEDEDNNNIVNQIEFAIPGDEDGMGEFLAYAEWMPDETMLYAEALVNGEDGMTLIVQPNGELENGVVDEGFLAMLSAMSGTETIAQIILQYNSTITEDDEGARVWDASVMLGYLMDGSQFGGQLLINQRDLTEGDDVRKDLLVDAYLLMNADTYPIGTLEVSIETGEPGDPPYTVKASDSYDAPGEMDEVAFEEWMEDTNVKTAQAGMGILSKLPTDFAKLIMSSSSNSSY